MALTDASPAFGPAERKGVLRLASRGLQTSGSMAQDVGRLFRRMKELTTGLWVFGFEIWGDRHAMLGVWHDLLVFGTVNLVFGMRSWVFGSAVGEIPTWCNPTHTHTVMQEQPLHPHRQRSLALIAIHRGSSVRKHTHHRMASKYTASYANDENTQMLSESEDANPQTTKNDSDLCC